MSFTSCTQCHSWIKNGLVLEFSCSSWLVLLSPYSKTVVKSHILGYNMLFDTRGRTYDRLQRSFSCIYDLPCWSLLVPPLHWAIKSPRVAFASRYSGLGISTQNGFKTRQVEGLERESHLWNTRNMGIRELTWDRRPRIKCPDLKDLALLRSLTYQVNALISWFSIRVLWHSGVPPDPLKGAVNCEISKGWGDKHCRWAESLALPSPASLPPPVPGSSARR